MLAGILLGQDNTLASQQHLRCLCACDVFLSAVPGQVQPFLCSGAVQLCDHSASGGARQHCCRGSPFTNAVPDVQNTECRGLKLCHSLSNEVAPYDCLCFAGARGGQDYSSKVLLRLIVDAMTEDFIRSSQQILKPLL